MLSYTVFFIWSVTGPFPAIFARIAAWSSPTVISSGVLSGFGTSAAVSCELEASASGVDGASATEPASAA